VRNQEATMGVLPEPRNQNEEQTGIRELKQTPRSSEIKRRENEQHTQDPKIEFSIKINSITTDPRRPPSSLPHLIIGNENEFLAR
jgi:hypothetical protein